VNVLRPGCARPPRWSPPVLWRRFEDGLALASAFSSVRARWSAVNYGYINFRLVASASAGRLCRLSRLGHVQ